MGGGRVSSTSDVVGVLFHRLGSSRSDSSCGLFVGDVTGGQRRCYCEIVVVGVATCGMIVQHLCAVSGGVSSVSR